MLRLLIESRFVDLPMTAGCETIPLLHTPRKRSTGHAHGCGKEREEELIAHLASPFPRDVLERNPGFADLGAQLTRLGRRRRRPAAAGRERLGGGDNE